MIILSHGSTETSAKKVSIFVKMNFVFHMLILVYICVAQDEILLNPGFEEPLTGDDWYSVSCDLIQDMDAYKGSFSGRVSNRNADWATARQDVILEPNTNYYFSMYVKLLNMAESVMWHQADLFAVGEYPNGTSEYFWSGRLPYLRTSQGWQKVAGDFKTTDDAFVRFSMYLKPSSIDEVFIDYLVDEASLKAFYANPNWKEEANERIEQLRKNQVTINFGIEGAYEPENLVIQVNQVSQSFPFGSAVVASQIAGDSDYNQRYQDTFYTNFNWAVIENALKWTKIEPERGEILYPDEAIDRLNQKSVPVRGHCVFWGKESNVPDWLKGLSQDEILEDIQRRIDYVVPRYVNKLIHWDVNNEQLHGSWFEEATGDPDYLNTMFLDVRAKDNNSILFINDYQVVNAGGYTQAIMNSALEVNVSTGQVGAIGVQSHINGYPDIAAMQKRLDEIETSGFPMWITELSIDGFTDRDIRADAYDDVVTLYYAHPGVKGILLWGFSDNHHPRPDCALFEGDYFEANAAGERWQEIIFLRWRSYETFYPQSLDETFGFRGYHGKYQIQVRNGEDLIQVMEFILTEGQDTTVNVTV